MADSGNVRLGCGAARLGSGGGRAAVLVPLLLAGAGGCDRPEGPRVSAEPARLELVREWMRVDLIGYRLAVDWPRVFTSHIEEARILEYRAPEGRVR